MTDLRAEIALLKATTERMPRDTVTRPFYEAILGCFRAIDEKLELLALQTEAVAHLVVPSPDRLALALDEPVKVEVVYERKKRVGWPKGKPRKVQPAISQNQVPPESAA